MKNVPMNLVRVDGDTQMRVGGLQQEVVDDYAEIVEDLAPVKLWFDGTWYWLGDGHHTHAARKKLGKSDIPAIVKEGTREDAEQYSMGANNGHGLRRTQADKRNAVIRALAHPKWGKGSSRDVANLCNVSHHLVQTIRSEQAKAKLDAETKAGKTNTPNTQTGINSSATHPAASKTTPAAAAPAACDPDDEEPGAEAQAAPATEPAAPAPSLDQVGRALPADAQGVVDAFAELPKFASIKARIGALKSELDQLAEGPAGRWVGVNEKDWKAHVQSLHRVIRYCAPYAVCPTCGGRKCETCKHTGYLPEEVFNALAPEVRGTTRKGGKAA